MADSEISKPILPPDNPSSPGDWLWIRATGIILLSLPFALFIGLVGVWPTTSATGEAAKTVMVRSWFFGDIHIELALMLVVVISGALGSTVFTARAFALHLAKRDFGMSWMWWYAIRIPVGMSLALILYLVLRGGLFAGNFADPEIAKQTVNPFGFAGIATLAGMFAKEVSAKLAEIFDVMFQTDKDQPASQKPASAITKPVLTSISPTSIPEGTSDKAALAITLNGKNFPDKAAVTFGEKSFKPDTATPTRLTIQLAAADVAKPGKLVLTVVDSTNANIASNSMELTVTPKSG